jgi:hypothetical protein
MRNSKTYFDQVPLEIVRRTAQQDAPEENRNGTHRVAKKIQASKSKKRRSSSPRKTNERN